MGRNVPQQESLGEIVSRLLDDAKSYVRAEIALVKQTALSKTNAIMPAAIMIVVAIFLLQAALTVLVAALGMVFALWLGPAGGLAVGALIGLAVAGLLVWLAIGQLKDVA